MDNAGTRARLRAALRLLLSERSDAQLLYIPRGEAGLRRMIAALLEMRTPNENDAQLAALLDGIDLTVQS